MAYAYAEAEGKPQRVVPEGVSLGLAVDVERKDGTRTLIVPVIKNASAMTFAEFVEAYDERVFGARDNKLGADAYQGANITLTNPGGIGTVASVPRLMPGQGTIVATGAIAYPPGFTEMDPDKLSSLGVSKVMTMTSTYDHRVIQGAESGAFLRRIDQLLQGGEELLRERVRGARPERARGRPAPTRAVTGQDPVPAEAEARHRAGRRRRRRGAAPGRPGRHLHRQGPPHARPPGRRSRPARARAPRRPGARPRHGPPDPELMSQIPASVLRVAVPGETFAEALPHLQQTYCGTIAYEIEHISDHEQRVWLRQTIESGLHLEPFSDEQKSRCSSA